MKKLQFANYSRLFRQSRGTDVYSWCVFLKATEEVVKTIEMVEYTLHPTFPSPVREITDAAHSFALQSEGWGVFGIDIRVFFRDGQEQELVYALKLEEDDWPKGPMAENFDDQRTKAVYESLFDPKWEWEWRKLSTIAQVANVSAADASAALEKLDSKRFARKAYFRSIDNQELWGATCKIGVLPSPDAK